MLLYGAFLFIITFEYVYCAQCPYLDAFGKRKYLTCDSGCCGDIHNVYCCHHKYLAPIVLGSVIGFFLLVAFIVIIIHCCYRRRQIKIQYLQVTRNYGTISVPDGTREGSNNIVERPLIRDEQSPIRDDVVIDSEVEITITPATPQDQKEQITLHTDSVRPADSALTKASTDAKEANDKPEVEVSVTEETPHSTT